MEKLKDYLKIGVCSIVTILMVKLMFSVDISNFFLAILKAIPYAITAGISLVPLFPYTGQYIKNSIFQVHFKNHIQQNSIGKLSRTISCMKSKDKTEKFIEELSNLFVELEDKDNKNNKITYETDSHDTTIRQLEFLKDSGYIENLEYKKTKMSNLFIERIAFGNYKLNVPNKQMYKIHFNLTDKERNQDEIYNMLINKREEYQKSKVLEKKI